MSRRALDLTGQKFGRLTAIECLGSIKKRRFWHVKCVCGSEDLVRCDRLTNGETKSCGCLNRETQVALGKSKLRHGGTMGGVTSVEFQAWSNIKKRDHLIPIEWQDFQQFFKDLGFRPSDRHQLTRRDCREPHSKTNTHWIDPIEQQEHRKNLTHADLGIESFIDMRTLCLST